jgi:hypothetical protein
MFRDRRWFVYLGPYYYKVYLLTLFMQLGVMAMLLQKQDFVTLKELAVKRTSKRVLDSTAWLRAKASVWWGTAGMVNSFPSMTIFDT